MEGKKKKQNNPKTPPNAPRRGGNSQFLLPLEPRGSSKAQEALCPPPSLRDYQLFSKRPRKAEPGGPGAAPAFPSFPARGVILIST